MIARLTLTLRSPFLIGGEQELSAGLDAVLLRNALGKPIIPGTAIKGLLRDALMSLSQLGHPLATVAIITRWFGQSSIKDNEPSPGTLFVGDLAAANEGEAKGGQYSRVAINEDTGSALDGALQVIELPWPVGAEVRFSGDIYSAGGRLDDDEAKLLNLALEAILALGSMRGMGFGRITSRTLEWKDEATETNAVTAMQEGSDLLLLVRFGGPFVVASERPDHNSFVGSDLVPGGALKGAIAERIGDDPAANAVLSAVTVHHGYPVPETQLSKAEDFAPRPIARSIAILQGTKTDVPPMIDLIDHATVPLLYGKAMQGFAPLALAPDWKSSAAEAVETALAEKNDFLNALDARPRRERRTRAAIDSKTGTALERQLFSHDAVSPVADKIQAGATKPDELVWAFRITGTPGELEAFNQLVAGLRFSLGKLDTAAMISERCWVPPRALRNIGNKVVITLATPAILNTFAQLTAADGSIAEAYQAHFTSIDPGLTVDRFFASQKLITGYQAIRFRSNQDCFEPWVRTEVGSTFLLTLDPARSKAGSLKALVEGWVRHGLPAAGAVDAWRSHPYPRENGYGQIVVGKMTLPALPFGFSIAKRGAA